MRGKYSVYRLSTIQSWCYAIPLTGLAPPLFCACPKPGPEFPTSYVICVQSVNARGDCAFYWCWWNCWNCL